ncbi:MAG: MarR family transcriptional regulator [archaeon GW2011_AR13]|nr:MAG: MarR family transcriptional regulator [archaeon GW2011_AR13]
MNIYVSKHLKGKYLLDIYIKLYKSKMKNNFDVFFRRKPAMILVALKKNTRMRYGSVLAKEVDCTYSHAVKILQTLEELKLVEFKKKGRIKVIKLTKKGNDVADAIENINKLIK